MSSGNHRSALALALGLGLVTNVALADPGFDDFSELSLEDLLNQEVVTASRRAQKSREAPVITYVITSEELRTSGARSVPDALRMVPGLEVLSPFLSDSNVSARGTNQISANSLLVLVNGRSVTSGSFRIAMWEVMPISVAEVEKIEITRSPGSAIYGANAFAGVINIITKDPGSDEGGGFSSTTTEQGSAMIDGYLSGQRGEKLSYRVSAGYRQMDSFVGNTSVSETPRLNAAVNYDLSDDSRLFFEGGHADGRAHVIPSSLGGEMNMEGMIDFLRADYTRGGTRVRTYWNHYDISLQPLDGSGIDGLDNLATDSFDLEFYHSRELGELHSLTVGASYNRQTVDWDALAGDHAQNLYAVFATDEWRLSDVTLFSLGLRYDDHPLVGGQMSPRGSLVVSPHERYTVRASIGKSHRNPTYAHSYFNLMTNTNTSPFPLAIVGNRDLEPETVMAYEIGYQGLLHDTLMASLDLYHYQADGAISLQISETVPVPPAPAPGIPSEMTYFNGNETRATGGEFSIDWNPATWARFRGHYSYTWVEDAETGARIPSAPRYKGALSAQLKTSDRSTFYLASRMVSETQFDYTRAGVVSTGTASDYIALDVHSNYELLPDRLDLAIGVQNLMDRRYIEYPTGLEFRRQAYASFAVRF